MTQDHTKAPALSIISPQSQFLFSDSKHQSIGSCLQSATHRLFEAGVESARQNAEDLLAAALGLRRIDLYLSTERLLSPIQLNTFQHSMRRRLSGEPLQYILGEVEFMSLGFKVAPPVLIPRPETELLVEKTLEKCREVKTSEPLRVLDVGTGSGCIAVSLAVYLQSIDVTAIDVSHEALDLAGENARRHSVKKRLSLVHCDIHSESEWQSLLPPYDFLVSNPPYISLPEYFGLPDEIRLHEPRVALTDGGDGYGFYRRLIEIAPRALAPGGWMAIEIDPRQAPEISAWLSAAGFRALDIHQDLAVRERLLICQAPC